MRPESGLFVDQVAAERRARTSGANVAGIQPGCCAHPGTAGVSRGHRRGRASPAPTPHLARLTRTSSATMSRQPIRLLQRAHRRSSFHRAAGTLCGAWLPFPARDERTRIGITTFPETASEPDDVDPLRHAVELAALRLRWIRREENTDDLRSAARHADPRPRVALHLLGRVDALHFVLHVMDDGADHARPNADEPKLVGNA